MAITVVIPGTATAIIDERDVITASLQVQIKRDTTIIGDSIITINVPLNTADILNFSVNQMISKINQFKSQCIKQDNIQTALGTFTNLVKAGV